MDYVSIEKSVTFSTNELLYATHLVLSGLGKVLERNDNYWLRVMRLYHMYQVPLQAAYLKRYDLAGVLI